MNAWTPRERFVLFSVGAVALVGAAVRVVQHRRPPLDVVQGPEAPTATWEAQLQQARVVDVNRATVEDLERLPQIGPAMARRIVDYRQTHGHFREPNELMHVPGIGPKMFDAIREYISVQ